jgi:hypothetical protein
VLVVLDHPGGEAFAPEVSPALVPAVEGLGVDAVDVLEAVREAPELGLDDQVVVVRHQAEGVDPPLLPLDGAREQAQEEAVLVGCAEDGGARNASRRHVVDAFRRELFPWAPHESDASRRSDAGRVPKSRFGDNSSRFRHTRHGRAGQPPGTVPGG